MAIHATPKVYNLETHFGSLVLVTLDLVMRSTVMVSPTYFEKRLYLNIIYNTLAMESMTAIWYQKKEKLIDGPNIPKRFLDIPIFQMYGYMRVHELCSATLNRSHVMMIFASTDPFRKVIIFDSVENLWYSIYDLQLEYDLFLNHCRASVAIDKSGKK
jgi:hypothetical protein